MPTHRLYPALAVASAILAASAVASAEEGRRVGVVVTVAVNLEPDEVRALATELGDALARELPVIAVAGREVERRLPPNGLSERCVAEPECRSDLGRRLDAEELLFLVAVRLGDTIQIDATWTDVASGRVASQPQVTLEGDVDRAAIFAAAAPRLLPHISRAAAAAPSEPPSIVVVTSPERDGVGGRRMTTGVWIAAGVAGVAAVGGGILGLSARQKFQALEQNCPDDCTASEIEAGERRALAADVLFGVAAGGAVCAAVLYLLSDTGDADGPGIAGLSVGGGPGRLELSLGGRF